MGGRKEGREGKSCEFGELFFLVIHPSYFTFGAQQSFVFNAETVHTTHYGRREEREEAAKKRKDKA